MFFLAKCAVVLLLLAMILPWSPEGGVHKGSNAPGKTGRGDLVEQGVALAASSARAAQDRLESAAKEYCLKKPRACLEMVGIGAGAALREERSTEAERGETGPRSRRPAR